MSKRLALIIGSSYYTDQTLSKLQTPDADVGSLADVLIDPELGGFDDVKLVPNMASHFVRREIANFFARKTRTDLLLLYFSGHGVLDDRGQLFLAVKDTDTKLLRGTAIPATFITDEMDNSHSQRQILILDCCHSGAFARGRKGVTGTSVQTSKLFEGTGFGRVVLTASDATQYAWEGDQIIGEAENSLFTHYLIQGITTGEADSRSDGRITVDELYDYIYTQIVTQTPNQTPGKWSFKEQGELIISQTPRIALGETQPERSSYRDEKDELDTRLKKIYTSGLSAFWLEDWEKACRFFEEIIEIKPDYEDAVSKLEQAKIQKKNAEQYQLALTKHQEGDLSESIKYLEELLTRTPNYKDAATHLERFKKEKQLNDLIVQAQTLFESGNYQAVLKVFATIRASYPDYLDPDGLLQKAVARQKELDRQKELEDLYHQALVCIDDGNLKKANKLLHSIQRQEPGYLDTEKLIQRVDELLKRKISAPKIVIAKIMALAEKLKRADGSIKSDFGWIPLLVLVAINLASMIYVINSIYKSHFRLLQYSSSLLLITKFDLGWLVMMGLIFAGAVRLTSLSRNAQIRFYSLAVLSLAIMLVVMIPIPKTAFWKSPTNEFRYFVRVDLPWLVALGLIIARWGKISNWSRQKRIWWIALTAVWVILTIFAHSVIQTMNIIELKQSMLLTYIHRYHLPWFVITGLVIVGLVALVNRFRSKRAAQSGQLQE